MESIENDTLKTLEKEKNQLKCQIIQCEAMIKFHNSKIKQHQIDRNKLIKDQTNYHYKIKSLEIEINNLTDKLEMYKFYRRNTHLKRGYGVPKSFDELVSRFDQCEYYIVCNNQVKDHNGHLYARTNLDYEIDSDTYIGKEGYYPEFRCKYHKNNFTEKCVFVDEDGNEFLVYQINRD